MSAERVGVGDDGASIYQLIRIGRWIQLPMFVLEGRKAAAGTMTETYQLKSHFSIVQLGKTGGNL